VLEYEIFPPTECQSVCRDSPCARTTPAHAHLSTEGASMQPYVIADDNTPTTPPEDPDELPTPAIIIEILEEIEDYFGHPDAVTLQTFAQLADRSDQDEPSSP